MKPALAIPAVALLLIVSSGSAAQERRVDPTFLKRFVPELQPVASDLTTPSSDYRAIFGEGDSSPGTPRGVARFGEVIVGPGGATKVVRYPAEEQVYVILEGDGVLVYGQKKTTVRKNDFMYLPPGVAHGIEAPRGQGCRFIVMGFRVPPSIAVIPPSTLQLANIDEVELQTVGNHPPSTQYRLLMGDTHSRRDRIAAAHVLTSLFIMEFTPGGTNVPHHHDREEEIYLLLDGHGDMVAGGGMDGVEGRHPARAGDAFYFRLNCTVGFYARNRLGEPPARILAVRSLYPSNRPQ